METLSPCFDVGSTASTPTTTFNNELPPTHGDVSPQSVQKNAKKVTSPQRSKAPPIIETSKNKKTSNEASSSSPKSKTWKGKLGRHLKRMQGSTTAGGTPVSPPSEYLPEGASIGACLEDCPPVRFTKTNLSFLSIYNYDLFSQSPDNEYLPLLVSLCVRVVESKGLNSQGIYRVPGNRAAVTYLTEVINKGPDALDLTDHRYAYYRIFLIDMVLT